tara:strand:+ start:1140 stop:1958 length:819 start_codon:yes stop_codon:yes gene_type:complete
MEKKTIKGLRDIQDRYQSFFIDLWGVIHNGIELYPEAIEVLENLEKIKKRYILMSNAPRPSRSVQKYLLNLNMDEIYTKKVFTSGEAAIEILKRNIYGKKFYHLGPERDNDLVKNLGKNKTSLEKCDFILCTGLFDEEKNSLEHYKKLLNKFKKIKMVCTNPDLIVHRGKIVEYCAGSVAQIFEKIGGKVIYVGKPYPDIYNFCKKGNEKILVIGDNIRTDIKGANNMKFDSLFITQGIHKEEFRKIPKENYDEILQKYKVKTNYYQEKLIW